MKKLSKIFAVVLCLSMLMGMALVASADATTAKVTDAATIKQGGSYVLVVEYNSKYYAVKNEATGKPAAVEVTVSGNSVSVSGGNLPVWTVAASGAGISLNDGTKYLAYNSSTNFKSSTTAETLTVAPHANVTGAFTVTSTASATRALAFQWNNGNCRFGAYATSNNTATNTDYSFAIQFFKVTGTQTDTREDLPTTSGAIVDAIFELEDSEKLSDYYKYEGDITLTGVVSGTTNWYDSSKTGNVNFKVKDSTGAEKTIQAYKLGKGTNTTDDDVKNLTTGDTITVSGSVIKNYKGTYEFDVCKLVSVTKGQVVLPKLPTTTGEILNAIFALKTGEALDAYYQPSEFTITGTVVGETSWSDQYGDGQVTFKVDGTDKELLAYQFKAGSVDAEVAKALASGDKVTFTATEAKNYNGTFELIKPVLTAVEKNTTPVPGGSNDTGDSDDTGDSTSLVLMMAVMALSVCAMAFVVTSKKTV